MAGSCGGRTPASNARSRSNGYGCRCVRRGFIRPSWYLGAALALLSLQVAHGQQRVVAGAMTFFVTSAGRGFGGNLGGLAGADGQCLRLATTVGQGGHTWRAYLSAPAAGGQPAVNARDRIGTGPWVNVAGVQIASSVAELHAEENNLTQETAL